MLITIGIVGVVASMTLPSVIENHKKQETLSKIKKVYSILSQAQIRAITENGDYEFWENGHLIGANDYFNKYYKPYFSILKICNNYCGYGVRFPWKQMNGTGWPHSIFINDYKLPFILSDGVLVVFSVSTGNDDPDKAREDSKIYVDINAAKAPNRLGQV